MTAQVLAFHRPGSAEPPSDEDRRALLEAVFDLHALLTLDPVLGASPVRVYFVFNPEARKRIAASIEASDETGRRAPPAYALVAYDFPFALHQLRANAPPLPDERAKQIVLCSAKLQTNALRQAAAMLDIEATPITAFDADALKTTFFPTTQETVIQLFALRQAL